MKLYLVRHGKAGDSETWTGNDELRPLTEDGRAEMLAAARGLATLQLGLVTILSSPLARAAQTADIIAHALGVPVTTVSSLAPGCRLADIGPVLASYATSQSVVIVGHEPDFSEIIGELIAGPSGAHVKMKKGACCRIDIADKTAASAAHGNGKLLAGGTLVWLLPAPQLASIGMQAVVAPGDQIGNPTTTH